MKKIITAALAAALFLTGMTACGSKDNVNSYDTTSRVLYTDSDVQTDTESAESSEEESSKAEKKVVTTDSESTDKKKDSSSKKTTSKAASSKAASSKAASSKTAAASSKTAAAAATSRPTTTTSTAPAASSTSSADSTDTSSETETDTQTIDTETDTQIIDTESDIDSASDAPSDPFDPSVDLTFSYGSTVIRLGDDIGDVVSAIGEPDSVTTAGNCLGGGEIKLYSYASYGFNIQAYPDGGDSFNVTVISLVNSDVMTEKGVKIGTSEEDMLAIYGDNYEAVSSTTYRYTAADGSYLQFYIEDGEVADIMMSLDTTNM